jgi:hypothetical protein
LKPTGIENVGGKMITVGEKPYKGHVTVRILDSLINAADDASATRSNSSLVEKSAHHQGACN